MGLCGTFLAIWAGGPLFKGSELALWEFLEPNSKNGLPKVGSLFMVWTPFLESKNMES